MTIFSVRPVEHEPYSEQARREGDWSVPLYDFGFDMVETLYLPLILADNEEIIIQQLVYVGDE